jgi:O-antigen/teichoic acid export membrane protein
VSTLPSPYGSGLLGRIARNAAALAAGGLVAQLCLFAVEVLIARRLGRTEYGTFSAVFAIGMASLAFFEFGMGWKVLQDGSRDVRRLPALLGTTLVLKLLLAALVYGVLVLLLPRLGYGPDLLALFGVLFGYFALLALQESLAAVNAARLQMHRNAAWQAATPLLVLIAVALGTTWAPALLTVAWAYVLASAAVTTAWAVQTFRDERPRVVVAEAVPLLRGSALYGASGLLNEWSYRVEVLALSLLRGPGEVALFAAADRFSALFVKVSSLSTRVVAPVLFNQSEHHAAQYARSARLLLRGMAVLGSLGALAIACLAEPLVSATFGDAFRPAGLVLMILAPSVALRFAMAGLRVVLSSSGQHVRRTVSLGGGVGTAIAANALLIPAYGIAGAALARVSGDLVQLSLQVSARHLPFAPLALLTWIAAPALLAAGAFYVATVAFASAWLTGAAALILYSGALIATRSIHPRELGELLRLLRAARRSRAGR